MNTEKMNRFLKAHEQHYDTALREVRSGQKRTCWMWFMFPQVIGLGFSKESIYYAIESYEQAEAYLENETLRDHYVAICEAICVLETDDIEEIFPYPDNLKLHSSLTLFLDIDPDMDAPKEVLDRFFYGKKDKKTLAILEEWMGF